MIPSNKQASHLWKLVDVFLTVQLAVVPLARAEDAAPLPERLALWTEQAPVGDGTFAPENAFITVHRPTKGNGAAVLICPGGGYGGLVADHEGHLVARWLNEHGVAGIVLEYRLPHGRSRVPLLDAQRALRMVRAKAGEWQIDRAKLGVMGFSAGGHLAATATTHFDDGDPQSADQVGKQGCRPDFAILIYPVVTMGPQTHGGSKTNLLGKEPSVGDVEYFSNEKQVTGKSPPTMLAHAQDDGLVSPANSEMFYAALRAHQVPAKYLRLPTGGHGLNGYRGPMWEAWKCLALEWLAALKMIPAEATGMKESAPSEAEHTPDAIDAQLADLGIARFPLIDFHTHLKGGLTVEDVARHTFRTGIFHGVAANCGLGFPVTNDVGVAAFLQSMTGQPVFVGMQAEGREWTKLFSPAAVARFDYVFTDSMTLFDQNGKRTRLWMKEEVEIPDKQAFMEHLTETTVKILHDEPIDIYANPTFLPDVIAGEYDALWTPARMRRIVEAAAAHGVAIELNSRLRLPGRQFVKLAKQAGLKFTLGVNNTDTDTNLGRAEYGLEMIRECGLTCDDFWMPKPNGQKPVQLRKQP